MRHLLLPGLVLLLGLLLNAAWRWKAWRSSTQLFQGGGVAIDTAAPDEAASLRTVIQADGDVLVIVHGRPNGDLVAEHGERVEDWYEANRRAVSASIGSLSAVITGVSAGAGVGGGWSTFESLHGIAGLAADIGVFTTVSAGVRLVLGRLGALFLRRRIDRWLGTAGVST